MEWRVKYEPYTHMMPWCVYKFFDNQRIFEQSFWTQDEAVYFSFEKEKLFDRPDGENIHKVDEASLQSFPASDPPAWIG